MWRRRIMRKAWTLHCVLIAHLYECYEYAAHKNFKFLNFSGNSPWSPDIKILTQNKKYNKSRVWNDSWHATSSRWFRMRLLKNNKTICESRLMWHHIVQPSLWFVELPKSYPAVFKHDLHTKLWNKSCLQKENTSEPNWKPPHQLMMMDIIDWSSVWIFNLLATIKLSIKYWDVWLFRK